MGDPIKLMCGSCSKRAGIAKWGTTPNGDHVWIIDTRRVIEGARGGHGSDWFDAGIYVDPKASINQMRLLTCPYCGSDLKLVLEDLEKGPNLKHIGKPEKDRIVLDPR